MTSMELNSLKYSLMEELMSIDSREVLNKIEEYIKRTKSKAIIEEDSDKLILDNMKAAFKELKAIKSGKGKARPIEEVLNEL